MYVYIAKRKILYEGEDILGVYANEGAAERCCDAHKTPDDAWQQIEYVVEEHEVIEV